MSKRWYVQASTNISISRMLILHIKAEVKACWTHYDNLRHQLSWMGVNVEDSRKSSIQKTESMFNPIWSTKGTTGRKILKGLNSGSISKITLAERHSKGKVDNQEETLFSPASNWRLGGKWGETVRNIMALVDRDYDKWWNQTKSDPQ